MAPVARRETKPDHVFLSKLSNPWTQRAEELGLVEQTAVLAGDEQKHHEQNSWECCED